MKPTYRVRDWDKHFENHESRKVKRSYWVPIPNRHDGKSYRRIASHPDGVAVFAAWILILEAASKMPERGVLADEDGPLDAEDLASMTGFPAAIFEAAFQVLPQDRIGWLEAEEAKPRRRRSPAASRNLPQSPDVTGTSAVELQGTTGNGTKEKDTELHSAKAGASANADSRPESHAQKPQTRHEAPHVYVNRVLREGGLTRMDVSKRAQKFGHSISPAYVAEIAAGVKTNPQVSVLKALAAGLGRPEVEVFDVFRGERAERSEHHSEFTIWRLGVGKLMAAGMEEQAARSFLGVQCKNYGKPTVADAVTKMLAEEPADPKTYLVGVLQGRAGPRTKSKADHSMDAVNQVLAEKEAQRDALRK